ncbi:MAG: TIGR03915 family putative DNA repair protein [Ferruginibacter sp.]|nr:TIGR03915 family putative DNA repair protein [Ferruginibacter sp.]
MDIVTYDGSWQGFFSAVFEVYEYKLSAPSIYKKEVAPASLFGKTHEVITNETKAKRVMDKLKQKLSPKAFQQLYKTFLSEQKDVENTMLRYIQYILSSKALVENNYTNADVLLLQQVSKKVDREKHRMEAFVRFQLTKDELYYAIVQPDYNVLPLILTHFKNRYADQRWLIYDALRKYGIYYDLHTVTEVQIDFSADVHNKNELASIYDEKEILYQTLWQQYFSSVNIKARKNMKLHIQHMPKRYWKYLIEKH